MTRPQSGSAQSHQETSIRQQGQAQLNRDPRDATATGQLTLTRHEPIRGGSAAPSLARRVSLALPSRCGASLALALTLALTEPDMLRKARAFTGPLLPRA